MNRTRRPDGFTLIELLFVVAVIGILSAIAAPGLSRAKMAANESSALASVRVINSGQQVFWASCGGGYYAPSLQNLGQRIGGTTGYVSPDVSGPVPVVKSGYEFDMVSRTSASGTSCNGGSVVAAYHITADALPGQGRRYFGSNSGGGIFQSSLTLFVDMPDSGSPPAPAIPIQQ